MKRFLLCMTALLALAACHRIPMYEAGSGVYLKLNLQLEPEAVFSDNIDLASHPELLAKVNAKRPELVRVCFYDAESHELVAEDFLPPEGGFVSVSAGAYDILVYGLGTEVTQVEGTRTRAGAYAFSSPTGARVKLRSAQVKADDGDGEDEDDGAGQPVIYEPDHLMTGRIAGAVIPVHPEGESESVVLESEFKQCTESWSLEFLAVEGTEYIASAEAYIIGQAAGRYLWDSRSTNHPASLVCPLVPDTEKGHLWTVFNTFGKYPQAESDVVVDVLVTTTGGARCSFIFDVTDQWLNPDNTAHRIVIDTLMEIPDENYSGGGFEPIVDEWDGEEIDVIIG